MPARATESPQSTLDFSGDIRLLVAGLKRDDRDGMTTTVEEGFLRLRAGATWKVRHDLSIVTRAATTIATSGNEWDVGGFPGAQTSVGLAPGNITLDLAHVQLDVNDRLRLRIGRFQESLELPAVPDKSLDRKDSDSVTISYSDGVSADYDLGRGWRLLGIAQYNPSEGATNRPREPLSFEEDGSRVSGFFALRRTDSEGPWAFSSLSFSVFPDTLSEDGRTRTYTTTVANLMGRVPLAGSTNILIGGSVGYAPNIPETTTATRAQHWAWQATANLIDIGPHGQSVGVIYMDTGNGWLVSPDLTNNSWLAEVRYRIRPINALAVEARLRFRGDAEQLPETTQKRRDRDWYLRLTWRF